MPISRSLFELKGNLPRDFRELESRLSRALVDTALVSELMEPDWVRELCIILAEYQREDITAEDFARRVGVILS